MEVSVVRRAWPQPKVTRSFSLSKFKAMSDTEKRYTYQLAEGVTATFNTDKPDPRTVEVLVRVIELAKAYKPKQREEPWHPGCPKRPSEGDCNCG